MTYRGHIENGQVVFEQAVDLPEGAEVEVAPLKKGAKRPKRTAKKAEVEGPTWYEVMKDVIGKIDGLPSDFAENHDHYIHGTPKR